MQKTHGSPLLIRRARLYDRADDHLGQTAADGIDHDGDADADIRIRCELRQDAEKHKSDGSKNMCQNGIDAVADPIREFCREQVHQNLCDKIDRHQKTDPGKGNPIGTVKCHKQKRGEIVDDRLCDVTDIAGGNGVSKISFNTHN